MRNIVLVALLAAAFGAGMLFAQAPGSQPEPSCDMCPAEFVPKEELAAYRRVAEATNVTDQQVRSLDIGKANVQVAYLRRGQLDEPRPQSVAEHSLVTEVYFVVDGAASILTGPDLVDAEPRPPDYRAVRFLNGPGHNAADVRNGVVHEVETGDVLVIPAGTGHQFVKIEDEVHYVMVRMDPDRVVPLMTAEDSQAYLAEHGETVR